VSKDDGEGWEVDRKAKNKVERNEIRIRTVGGAVASSLESRR